MSHLVWGELGNLKGIADPVKNIFDRPFRDRLARIAVRVRQKNASLRLNSIAGREGSTIFINILFEAAPGWMREHNGPWHLVFRNLGSNFDRVRLLVNIVEVQEDNFFST